MASSSPATTFVSYDDHTYPPPTSSPPESLTLKRRPWRPFITPFEQIHNHHYRGKGTHAEPYVVDWLPHDVEDPQLWPNWYKWVQVGITSMLTLSVALCSSAYAGGIPGLMGEFGKGSLFWTGGVSLFVLGFAFGPLLWAPASEVWGRRIVYVVTCFGITLFQSLVVASPNPASVLIFRCLAGFFGSSPLTNAGATIGDILTMEQRGVGMALFAAAPFLGPALGPITGGFLGVSVGWRWVMGFLGIYCGVMLVIMTLFAPETYAPILLRRRAQRLSNATGKVYRYHQDIERPLQIGKMFTIAIIRPWKLLIEPIVLLLSIYVAIIYGTLYLNFAAYPIIFEQLRGWNTGQEGLAFLGIAVGVMCAILLTLVYINKEYVKAGKRNEDGRPTPEDRLPPSLYGGIAIVIGLAGFAATNSPDIHFIAPIMFGIPFGFGMVITFLSIIGYLIDAYLIYAASVMAANSVLRSLFGAAFPLFTKDMYAALGIHWAAALPGFLALACLPFCWVFLKYGKQIRMKCKYAADSENTMKLLMQRRAVLEKEQTDEEKRIGAHNDEAGEHDDILSDLPTSPTTALGRILSNASICDPSHPHHHEWTQYTILADRDNTSLSDEERMRLNKLRHQFGRYHHDA